MWLKGYTRTKFSNGHIRSGWALPKMGFLGGSVMRSEPSTPTATAAASAASHHSQRGHGNHHHGGCGKPRTEEERAARADAMRACFRDDLARVDADLRSGGEEGCTDAQLLR